MKNKNKAKIYLFISIFLIVLIFLNFYLIPITYLTNYFGFEPNFNSFMMAIAVLGPLIALVAIFGMFLFTVIEFNLPNFSKTKKIDLVTYLKDFSINLFVHYFVLLLSFILSAFFILTKLTQGITENNYFSDQFIYYYLSIYFFVLFIFNYIYDKKLDNVNKINNLKTIILIAIIVLLPLFFN